MKGSVTDSLSGKPLAYVTVVLQDNKTQLAVKSALSSDDGHFTMSGSGEKTYNLVLAFIGYTNKNIAIPKGQPLVDIGNILLAPSGKQLKDVTVTATRPVMKREIDGISYDVTADPESVALSALDIMRKVPLLSVDASDNIKLKGSGNYKILLNGKESALIAKNPSDVLRAMPATNIEKIEVITTPPAKYDAEGLAGIINIITKKNVDQGYNIGVNGRYNSVWGPGVNLNGTFKQGKFGLSGYMGYNSFAQQTTAFGNTQTFFADNTVLTQDGTNKFNGQRHYGDLELSYELDSLNLLTGSVELFQGVNYQNNSQLSQTSDQYKIVQQKYAVTSSGNNSFGGYGAAFNYQRGFKKDKNRLLTLSYKYNYSPSRQYNNNTFNDKLNFSSPNYEQYNDAGNKEQTIQLDYVHPFRKLTLEAGGKAIIRTNFSNFQTNNYDDVSGDYIISPSQTNDFNYQQHIYSVYNSYQYKLEKWTFKAGLRFEHTGINANFLSDSSSVHQQYGNLIPSVSIQRNFAKSSFNFGYTDRISRPGIYQLNPFVDQSNPKFINTGNPNLKPELNHTLELNYSNFSKSAINIGLSYAFTKNAIQNVTRLEVVDRPNNTQDTVTLTTFENLGSNSRLGLSFNINLTLTKGLTVSLNGQVSHVWLAGTYNGQLYHNEGNLGNAFMNAGYKFGNGFRFGIDAGLFSGDVNLQGRSSGFIYSSYVFSKSFLNKKLTLSLVSNNPYSKVFTYRSYTTTPDFHQSLFN
ncbi:MAG TPA: TonB-dependent receptor, partial [Puia sp.]|nr:TonB-dependent receptor [Puia sp.]